MVSLRSLTFSQWTKTRCFQKTLRNAYSSGIRIRKKTNSRKNTWSAVLMLERGQVL